MRSSSLSPALIPLTENDFLINAVMIPFLIFSLAAIGLNLLTGYTGLLSLGTGAFMGVGAYACYKLTTIFPDVNIIIWIVASGFFAAAVGTIFGLPSLRIKGFYLAIATLAAQFFLEWCFIRIAWLYNYNISGAIEVPQRELFGIIVTGPRASAETRYYIVLAIVVVMTWAGLEHRARPYRPDVDGGARHGHRRRTHGHQACCRPSCSPSRCRHSTAAWPARCWCSSGTAERSRPSSTSTRASRPYS